MSLIPVRERVNPVIRSTTWPLGALVLSTVLCAMVTGLIRRWALARGFVDRPGGHKGHDRPIALGGGVGVTIAVILPILAGVGVVRWFEAPPPGWIPADLTRHLGGIVAKTPAALAVCGAAAVLCVLGLIDDRRPVGPAPKFAVQIVIACILVIGFDLRLLSHLPGVVSIGLSIAWILVLTNAMNFLDNMDGLACGVGLIAAVVFGVAAMLAGQIFVPTCCWLLAGALLGFLPYNFHPASIFLGDAGSTVIGLLLAVFTILTTFADPARGQQPFAVFAPLLVMAVPLYDTTSVFFLRWRSGAAIWRPDRRHFSHRLVRRGMGVPRAVGVIWLATLVTALPTLWLPRADWPVASGIVLQTGLVVVLVALLEGSGSHDKTQAGQ